MFSWDAVAVARNGNRAVANLHHEYGEELKKYSKLVDDWIAHSRRVEAENAALRKENAALKENQRMLSGASTSVSSLHKLVGEWQAKAAKLEAEVKSLKARVPA